jgi:hypothetical protein
MLIEIFIWTTVEEKKTSKRLSNFQKNKIKMIELQFFFLAKGIMLCNGCT